MSYLKPLEHYKTIIKINYKEPVEASNQPIENSNFLDVDEKSEKKVKMSWIFFVLMMKENQKQSIVFVYLM